MTPLPPGTDRTGSRRRGDSRDREGWIGLSETSKKANKLEKKEIVCHVLSGLGGSKTTDRSPRHSYSSCPSSSSSSTHTAKFSRATRRIIDTAVQESKQRIYIYFELVGHPWITARRLSSTASLSFVPRHHSGVDVLSRGRVSGIRYLSNNGRKCCGRDPSLLWSLRLDGHEATRGTRSHSPTSPIAVIAVD